LVTPLGSTVGETWDALLAGRYIADHAKVPLSFPDNQPRVSHLAIRAAREAIALTGLGSINDCATALVVGTSKGPVEDWLNPPSRLSDQKSPIDFGLAGPASDVAHALGMVGPRLTISAACASGLHALIRGAMLIQSGEAQRVLVVAAEASIHPLFLASFQRLGVLSSPGIGCRPFDRKREGFLMSEASAAVCIEAREIGFKGLAIDRFALGADASHLTASDVNGKALNRILASVVADDALDLIHAHGTGTAMNDSIELETIERILRETTAKPSLYSHKGALGHSLGAAGLVAVVINVMCHQSGMVPPNIRTTDPVAANKVDIKRTATSRSVQRSIALAAGFGGPIAAISLTSQD
jgi:3-oxoacyl-[acyl-carrier-protein] synthase II